MESSGAIFGNDIFGNESIKFWKPIYILTVSTDQGKYVINVIETSKPLVALAEAIEVGDRVRFLTSYWNANY